MKRFLLFSNVTYYPAGGWKDFFGSFDTAAEAFAAAPPPSRSNYDWSHVVDITTGKIVESA